MTTTARPKSRPKTTQQTSGYKDRPWIPRFWDGMNISAWFPLLVRNRCAVAPRRWAMAVIISDLVFFNSFLALLQLIFYGRKITRTRIQDDPIFIIGHWRTGTTLLHELLILDQRHTYPSTYACFAPNHFLLSHKFLPGMLRFLLPSRRPMDNMAAGWSRPQEDEFALCNMGAPSPYLTILFPNRPPQCQEYLDLEEVPPKALNRWKQKLVWFLKCITVQNPKRIVLKSPAHTCRIKTLLELFPRARFVHAVRDPYVVFPSTVNLWKRLYKDQGLQVPKLRGLEEGVFQDFTRMYAVFERDRQLIDPSRYCEVRYEELIEDPIGQMRRVYDQLGLGGFEQVLPALEQYVAGQADYKTNRYEISPQTRAEIARRWGFYCKQYGYDLDLEGLPQPHQPRADLSGAKLASR